MENLKAFNLELALFLKTLHSYMVKVNEIDDETTQLLVETILAVNKLQNGSIYRETSFLNENRFLDNLNEEQFICRRHIVCRLCHIDFPLTAEEFKIHVEKKSHKGEVAKIKLTQVNSNSNQTIQAAACDSKIVVKDRFNSNLTIESRSTSTSSSIGSSNLSVDCALITNVEKKNHTGEVTKVKLTQVNSNSKMETVSKAKTIAKKSPNAKRNAEVLDLVGKKLVYMWSFSESRQRADAELVSTITKYIHSFDASLGIVKIGSSQYGIKGPTTNVNLLVNTHGNKPNDLSKVFHFKLNETDIHKHFKEINKSNANRVLRGQINMIHINSGLQCTLLFDKDDTIVESTEIIKCYVDNDPKCRFLITFIKRWQDVLTDLNIANFNFNTYIISVLVIFFLQVNHQLPLIKDISNLRSKKASPIDSFKKIPLQFFEFYGNRYQIGNHVISAHIGQWQERRLQSEQRLFGEAKQRLRNGIEKSPDNWKNCTMYVQDLMRFDVNITAEIPKAAAEQFQRMCQKFAK